MYTFSWKHENNFIQLPVKLDKSVDDGYGISGQLVCNECQKSVKQVYKCTECEWQGSIGEIKKRLDKENNVVYEYAKKKAFMKSEIETNINVIKEIPLSEVITNVEFISGFLEVFSNEGNQAKATVSKIHKWLSKNNKCLLVTYGYREKNRAGLILPTKNKLILSEIRDYRLIRDAKQQGLTPIQSSIENELNSITEDKEPELYDAFIEKIKSGEDIPVQEVVETEREIIVQATFLDE